MKILHMVESFGRHSYGLGSISMGLAKAQLDLGEDVYVWSSDSEVEMEWAAALYGVPRERLFGYRPQIPMLKLSLLEVKKAISENSFDIVHQHSLWTGRSILTDILRRNGAKVCIASHGTLSPFALNKSSMKKMVALALYERRNLNRAHVLHATSELEIEDFRRLGLKNPIAYIENGIAAENIGKRGDGVFFKDKYRIPKNKKVLLYLSRITPKKGLDMLIKAVHHMGSSFQDWVLVIVGNDEFGFQKKVARMVSKFGLDGHVFFVEPQLGDAKLNAFEAADFFILPSRSEGSPMVVVDALAYGLPVITTKSSSWSDLERYECGYWADISEEAIRDSIAKMVRLGDQELACYRKNAITLVQQKYLWEKISEKTMLLYDWLSRSGPKPSFIY